MGWNTTVVVMNDALGDIRTDPEFGAKLVAAILKKSGQNDTVDVSAGTHVNAATVIETHHADQTAVVAVGGNFGKVLLHALGWDITDLKFRLKLAKSLSAKIKAEAKKAQEEQDAKTTQPA